MDEEKEAITLYEEYRLIEKSEQEINGAWKGAHLILFFMSFVFGSFCTFCLHILIYLFDENCILYPEVVSVKDLRRGGHAMHGSLIFDYVQNNQSIPVDFVTTRWAEKSQCYLPAYVPLLSSICGVVWTTMFLMCSSGSRTLTGLQRPWRIQPAVFVFSVAMGVLCTYTSYKTHNGLNEFCEKLGELTGSTSCTYTINVASLAYERQIRGVYQATRLTILSAWLHTFCWVGAAIVALLRVILIVDFRLVRVRADLIGNIEQMLERHEKHIRTDEFWNKDVDTSTRQDSRGSIHINFINKTYQDYVEEELTINQQERTIHYVSHEPEYESFMSLVPEENRKLARLSTSVNVPAEHRFIALMLHDLVDYVLYSGDFRASSENIERRLGIQNITKESPRTFSQGSTPTSSLLKISHAKGKKASLAAVAFKKSIKEKVEQTDESTLTSQPSLNPEKDIPLKSTLRHRSIQTTESHRKKEHKVQISTPTRTSFSENTLKDLDEIKTTSKTIIQVPDSNETNEFEKIIELKHNKSLSNITLKPKSIPAQIDYTNRLEQTESLMHTSQSFVHLLLQDAPASPKTTPEQASGQDEFYDPSLFVHSILSRHPKKQKIKKEENDEDKLNQNEQPPNLPLDVEKLLQEKGPNQHSSKERQDYEEEEEASTSKGKSKKDSAKEKQD